MHKALGVLSVALVLSGCGSDSPTEPEMQLQVTQGPWILGVRSDFTAAVGNWDGRASIHYRALFCPNILLLGWRGYTMCANLALVEEGTVTSSLVAKTFTWTGCTGTLFFVVTLIEDGVATQQDGSSAGCL